ncbi:MAG: hypothetical protein ABWZ54_06270 [Luteibacter sp.]
MNTTPLSSRHDPLLDPDGIASPVALLNRVSWGAILAGAILAMVLQLVLTLVGAGVGLSTVDPIHYDTPDASSYGMGAAIWWAVSSVLSLFAGGWVAGHLAGAPGRTDAMLHGLVTWGLASLLGAYLVASAVSSVVKGGAMAAGSVASAAGTGIAAAAGPAADEAKKQLQANGITMDSVKAHAQQLLAQTGKPALQPDALKQQADGAADQLNNATQNQPANGEDVASVAQRIIASGSDTVQQADRQALVNVVMARTGASQADAEQRVDTWVTQYQQTRAKLAQVKAEAETKAREAADQAAKATARTALGSAIALVLGAIAAGLGGALAGRRYVAVANLRRTYVD